MRKSLCFFSVLLIAGFSCLWGCDSDEEKRKEIEPDVITDIVSELNFGMGSNYQALTFTTNKEWEATVSSQQGDASWCSISPSSGAAGTVKIKVSTTDNTEYDDRNATITIKTGNTVKTLTVTQRQKNAIIISKDNYELSEEGGTIKIEANTNVELDVSIPTEANWLRMQTKGTRALSAKEVVIIVDKNNEPNVRTATITLKDRNSTLSSEITITQQGKKVVARTVQVDSPGTLKDLLGSDYRNIEELTITGKIHGDDVSTIRQISRLQYLDISDVFIVSGGRYYYKEPYETKANQISYSMFAYLSSLRAIILPNSVTSIGTSAFSGCTGLTSITIPSSVTSIWAGGMSFSVVTGEFSGGGMFAGCTNLRSVFVSPDNISYTDIDGVLTNKDKTELVFFPNDKSDSYVIPNSVNSIGESAFVGCSGLTSITIPNSVTSIGSYAFVGCSGLTSVSIPNSVTSIGEYVFYSCTGLTSVAIPNSVTYIGGSAFNGCSGLTSVTIPNSVTTIGDYAFNRCTGMTSITISNSVTSIGRSAFSGCSGLTSVTIPNSVTTIRDYAFSGCSGLTSVTIPNSVTSIRSYAFSGCSGLTSVSIPNSVTSIGEYAFYICTGLTSITFGSGIKRIGYDVNYSYKGETFGNCNKIEIVHIKATNPPDGDSDIPYKSTVKLYVPKGSKEKYQNSYGWKGFYQYIEE